MENRKAKMIGQIERFLADDELMEEATVSYFSTFPVVFLTFAK